MDFDARLIRDINTSERCELTAYVDTEGWWTVGWGHRLDPMLQWSGYTITQQQADNWRTVDLQKALAGAERTPEWPYLDTDCRRNAVVELCFNMGAGRWLGFVDTRAAIRLHNWKAAHDELLNSKWRTQVHEKRANRLANYLLTGAYPV